MASDRETGCVSKTGIDGVVDARLCYNRKYRLQNQSYIVGISKNILVNEEQRYVPLLSIHDSIFVLD